MSQLHPRFLRKLSMTITVVAITRKRTTGTMITVAEAAVTSQSVLLWGWLLARRSSARINRRLRSFMRPHHLRRRLEWFITPTGIRRDYS
ncbi:hypothetical protein [Dyella sp. 20L07]|uniref:hypothetical protein n=1 Tax=Dyella sp. 20L07 TaxID=3384240 RepID=UPI003D2B497D